MSAIIWFRPMWSMRPKWANPGALILHLKTNASKNYDRIELLSYQAEKQSRTGLIIRGHRYTVEFRRLGRSFIDWVTTMVGEGEKCQLQILRQWPNLWNSPVKNSKNMQRKFTTQRYFDLLENPIIKIFAGSGDLLTKLVLHCSR